MVIIAARPWPILVFDLVADLILHANPATSQLFGLAPKVLATRRMSELHQGQILGTGGLRLSSTRARRIIRDLAPSRADGSEVAVEYEGVRLDVPGARLVLLTISDLEEHHRREADAYLKGGIAEWQRVERFFPRCRAAKPADPEDRRRGDLRHQCRGPYRQPGNRTSAGLAGRRAGRPRHARHGPPRPW